MGFSNYCSVTQYPCILKTCLLFTFIIRYKGAVRKRVFNLRDKKNTDLRLNVLTGAISATKFAKMTSEVGFVN